MGNAGSEKSLNSKIMEVLDGIEYRRIDTLEDIAEAAVIRTSAYTVSNLLTLNGIPLVDEVDFDSHAYVFGVYLGGRLISTVRLHHVTPDHRVTTTFSVFPDHLNAWLDAGKSFIDPVRFAADPEVAKGIPSLPFVTLRLAVLAAVHLGTDYVVQLSTARHAAFYRRIFQGKQVAEPIVGGKFNIPLALQATDVAETIDGLLERFPFFRSTHAERAALFDRVPGSTTGAVRPTARECPDNDG